MFVCFVVQQKLDNSHAFLILGREENTMVLQTGRSLSFFLFEKCYILLEIDFLLILIAGESY